MVFSFRSESDAGTIIKPEPSTLWLFLRYFEAFLTPNPLYILDSDMLGGALYMIIIFRAVLVNTASFQVDPTQVLLRSGSRIGFKGQVKLHSFTVAQ
jgi:hypothetical protein